MTRLDLDEIADELEDHTVVVSGRSFSAPADLSIPQLLAMRDLTEIAKDFEDDPERGMERIGQFLEMIFGPKEGKELLSMCGIRRLPKLLEALVELYDMSPGAGKGRASSRPSKATGASSKRTSKGSTRSTSAKRASAPRGSAARGSRG